MTSLSEYSDENMMDPYNLAICFGPTLVPVPEDKDQVQYQNLVNELIKNVILFHDEIFVDIQDGVMYEKYISTSNNEDEHDDGHQQSQHQGSTASKSFMSESSPVLKKSLSCVEGGGGRGHSREDSNSSSLRAHTPSSVAATALMSEEGTWKKPNRRFYFRHRILFVLSQHECVFSHSQDSHAHFFFCLIVF